MNIASILLRHSNIQYSPVDLTEQTTAHPRSKMKYRTRMQREYPEVRISGIGSH